MKTIRIKNDVNGNGRFVVHFLDLVTESDREQAPNTLERVSWLFNRVLNRCKPYGGTKYRGKDTPGGIVFQESSETLLADTLAKVSA